jgi:DNA-binding SARP family transcriptional activator/WD40 repeat protein
VAVSILGATFLGEADTHLAPRDRVVLSALAISFGAVVTTDQLADAIWGDAPPASATKVIQGCVMRLRRALSPSAIETTPRGYRLAVPADEIDAQHFARLVARGQEQLTLGEPDRAVFTLDVALELWRGDPLTDLGDWEPARAEAARLAELKKVAEELRIEALIEAGRFRDVLADAEALVHEDSLREHRWALLARVQYQAGRQAHALRTLHTARRVLGEQLGIEPGPELTELEHAVLNQDETLLIQRSAPASEKCPYRGMMPYDVDDAHGFFGRGPETEECLAQLAAVGVLVVVGASGSGKSSLIRAGVAAALRRDRRAVHIVTPGSRPAIALGDMADSREVVLVVDQAEEALTLCDDPVERTCFFDAVVAHASQAPVVVAVRADHLGDLSVHPDLARLIERGLHLVSAMAEEDLREAIMGPAHQAGLLFEPGLVDLLVGELEGQVGALPLLSHALRETWERREGRTLTVDGYQATGGIRGAVAQTAERLYENATEEQRPALRNMLLRLVTPSPEGEPIPGRATRSAIAPNGSSVALLEELIAARLVAADDGMVGLAHESLVRAWPRLRGWLTDDIEGQRILAHVSMVSQAWDAMGRPDSELYRGARLHETRAWREASSPQLTTLEQTFLDDSETLERREALTLERRTIQQARVNRRLRILLASSAVLLVGALVASTVAWRQTGRAERNARAADARRAGALALTVPDVDHGLLLAAAAVGLDESPATRSSLLAALSRTPQLQAANRLDEPLVALDVSPDGSLIAVGGPFRGVVFLDGHTLERVGEIAEPPIRLRFAPDGATLALGANEWTPVFPFVALDDEPLVLVNVATMAPVSPSLGGVPTGATIGPIAYSADGRFLVATFSPVPGDGGSPTQAMVWDVDDPVAPIAELDLEGHALESAVTADGSRLVVTETGPLGDLTLRTYEVATGESVASVSVGSPSLAASADGAVIATLEAQDAVLRNAATLEEVGRVREIAPAFGLRLSPDARFLAAVAPDNSVVVHDIEAGRVRDVLRGHAGQIWGVEFSPDAETVYTISLDRAVLAWDLGGSDRYIPKVAEFEPGAPAAALASVPSVHGDVGAVLTGSGVQLVDLATGEVTTTIAAGPQLLVRWDPNDPTNVYTADEAGWVRGWTTDGELTSQLQVDRSPVVAVDLTADGSRVLAVSPEGAWRVVEPGRADGVDQSGRVDDRVGGGALSPSGDSIALLTESREVVVVDTLTGLETRRTPIDFSPGSAAFSPDGRRLAVVGVAGEVGLLDPASGRWVREPAVAHTDLVRAVSFSVGGELFVTGGGDGRVGLWDGTTGEPLGSVVPGSQQSIVVPVVLDDGRTVLIGGADGVFHRWNSSTEHAVAQTCRIVGRALTPEEWLAAFGARARTDPCA